MFVLEISNQFAFWRQFTKILIFWLFSPYTHLQYFSTFCSHCEQGALTMMMDFISSMHTYYYYLQYNWTKEVMDYTELGLWNQFFATRNQYEKWDWTLWKIVKNMAKNEEKPWIQLIIQGHFKTRYPTFENPVYH